MKLMTLGIAGIVLTAGAAFAQSHDKAQMNHMADSCPMMQSSHTDMNARGEQGMGFSQTETTHHFFLTADGGVIQVQANRADDSENRGNIQTHLAHIAKAFADGDFDIPMFVHDTVPPGVPVMKQLREKIRYTFETTSTGGRVVISTSDANARAAIHDFLRFQIQEHKTGDPLEPQPE